MWWSYDVVRIDVYEHVLGLCIGKHDWREPDDYKTQAHLHPFPSEPSSTRNPSTETKQNKPIHQTSLLNMNAFFSCLVIFGLVALSQAKSVSTQPQIVRPVNYSLVKSSTDNTHSWLINQNLGSEYKPMSCSTCEMFVIAQDCKPVHNDANVAPASVSCDKAYLPAKDPKTQPTICQTRSSGDFNCSDRKDGSKIPVCHGCLPVA
ncbi:hypothetical protein PGT21_029596 [Puccinia graminis f. sp. tritici]|uniref:Uncharacterized protein n=1 Tax=Puccinia graminis f. sp. tritici TaxID=56615 RepID=A0A5B0MGM3_PUCGR|nr:hypothetical protein PGTUg99_027027 [Puccinia graminis f. sp. tritici]KAA1091256.1 hypothetical protein PGT21_029596 [Puccinia graminis f. sp. tritici]